MQFSSKHRNFALPALPDLYHNYETEKFRIISYIESVKCSELPKF